MAKLNKNIPASKPGQEVPLNRSASTRAASVKKLNVAKPMKEAKADAKAAESRSKELTNRLQDYEVLCMMADTKATISGTALALGFSSVKAFKDAGKDPELKDIIDKAMLLVENRYEEDLTTLKNPVGAIFALKRLGWSTDLFGEAPQKTEEKDSLAQAKSIQIKIVR